MKLFTSSLVSAVMFSLVVSPIFVMAAPLEKTPQEATQTPITIAKPVLLATVNIQDAQIVSQDGQKFTISFNLNNREGLQTGVRYSVKLFAEKGQFPLDEKVYEESLTLAPNTTTKKEIVYTAPRALEGAFQLFIASSNSSGFPFGLTPLGKVNLSSSIKGIEIVPESCTLQVDGEDVKKRYTITQGVDVDPNETLRVTCLAINAKDTAVSAIPSFETRHRTLYGELVAAAGGAVTPISFDKFEQKAFSVVLPKASKPQAYTVTLALKDDAGASNAVNIRYIIRGASATVQNLSFDKDYYAEGEQANISLVWSPSADSFSRSRASIGTPIPNVVLSILFSDYHRSECTETFSQTLAQDMKTPRVELAVPIISDCFNPKALVIIKDDKGNVLDQKTFIVETTSVPRPKANVARVVGISILLLAFIFAGYKAMKKKKKNDSGDYMDGAHPVLKAILPLIVILGSFMTFNTVHADTFYVGSQGGYATATVDKSTYVPGEAMYVSASIDANNGLSFWDPGYESAIRQYLLTAVTNGNSAVSFFRESNVSFDLCYWSGLTGTVCETQTLSWPVIYGSFTFTAPSTPGSYNVTFQGAFREPDATFYFYNEAGGLSGTSYVLSMSIQNDNTGATYSISTTDSYRSIVLPKGPYTITSQSLEGCQYPSFGSSVGTTFTLSPSNLSYGITVSCYES